MWYTVGFPIPQMRKLKWQRNQCFHCTNTMLLDYRCTLSIELFVGKLTLISFNLLDWFANCHSQRVVKSERAMAFLSHKTHRKITELDTTSMASTQGRKFARNIESMFMNFSIIRIGSIDMQFTFPVQSTKGTKLQSKIQWQWALFIFRIFLFL
jgi:cyanate permease